MTAYDDVVYAQQPKHFYPRLTSTDMWYDPIDKAHGKFPKGHGTRVMPDGTIAPYFDGATQYSVIPDRSALGPAGAKSAWTVSLWMRPEVTIYPNDRSEGYVHWIGKGKIGEREWLMRAFSADSKDANGDPYRQGWLSCYCFSASGQFGAGKSWHGPLVAGTWYHITFVVRLWNRTCAMWLNGAPVGGWSSLVDTEGRVQFDVKPSNGTAPLLVGKDTGLNSAGKPRSWFKGAVGKMAFFTYDLSTQEVSPEFPAGRISKQYQAMPV